MKLSTFFVTSVYTVDVLQVNHVQLDNQLAECLYPVIAAPVPPPRSVTAVSVPKPFVELSVLEYTSPEHNMKQYKYIHALVQVRTVYCALFAST